MMHEIFKVQFTNRISQVSNMSKKINVKCTAHIVLVQENLR
jgi:hypothetical protein